MDRFVLRGRVICLEGVRCQLCCDCYCYCCTSPPPCVVVFHLPSVTSASSCWRSLNECYGLLQGGRERSISIRENCVVKTLPALLGFRYFRAFAYHSIPGIERKTKAVRGKIRGGLFFDSGSLELGSSCLDFVGTINDPLSNKVIRLV
ncbi:hypothetical protein NPIL_437031 [Nephila pilipes]|uniref:Uncharacterized protein n=1 Tax=Nephila pilipes TaxID=299642 RepID=A0A8X6QWX7_NEPPI|nr:hypothetical protein NPIL_437031 [Nephila pilipes]